MVVVRGFCIDRWEASMVDAATGEAFGEGPAEDLVSLGIDGGRLETVSFGKEKPFDLGHTEEAWSKNRRAHPTEPQQPQPDVRIH